MSTLFATGIGAVLSADIAVPEHERVVRFYARVLSSGAQPLFREADLWNNLGMPIVGVGARSADSSYERLPLQWMPHIMVADVAASVQHALDLGGQALMHAKDDAGRSQWAVLLDRDAAAFGIIPVVAADAMPVVDEAALPAGTGVGRINWLDLTVPDAAAAQAFYQQVIGWSVQPVELTDRDASYADFNMLLADGAAAAGICHARGLNAAQPPVWMIYLPVGDLAESLRRVDAEGGSVLRAMPGADGTYMQAVIQDPVGAQLTLTAA